VNPGEQGALLVEALVVSVVVTIALLGTIGLINISTQQRQRAGERNQLNAAIDADLADIKNVASQLTCCTGECNLDTPSPVGPDQLCATNNRRDDRYFYPQLDTEPNTEGSEAEDVDDICNGDGILADLNLVTDFPANPALAAAGGARAIAPLGDDNGNQNILQVTYTDTNQGGAVVRVARVVPESL
jgi:hypothetical protein